MSEVEKLMDKPKVEVETLRGKVASACAEMPTPKLDKVNPHFKSKYVSLAALNAAIRPTLMAHGVSYRQTHEYSDGVWWLVTYAYDAHDEVELSRVVAQPHGKAQERGSDLTYSKRQGLSAAFGIVADDDDDGNAATAPANAPVRQPEPARDEFKSIFANYRDALNVDGKTALSQLQLECGFDGKPDDLTAEKRQQVQEHMLARIAGVANG